MQLTVFELLEYNDEELEKWARWFEEHGDGPLKIQLPGTEFRNLGELVRHTMGPQLVWAERLRGAAVTEWWKDPSDSAGPIFDLGRRGSGALREFAAAASGEDWTTVREFSGGGRQFRMTPRKVVCATLIHAIRHWAQVALAVRQNGLQPPGEHDVFFTRAFE